ncbi:MAG: hypothetical protein KDD70_19255, partial [Bdellovibrionales bacterium]|nr:hypothetical protein [Bdellovibrionales bacterium]
HDPHKGTAYKIIIDPDGAVKGMHNSAITMHLRYLRDADYMPENRDAAISAGAEILRQLKNKAGDPVRRSKIQR